MAKSERQLTCLDSLIRIALSHFRDALVELRVRYDELVERKDFLPYEFNIRLPEHLDLDSILLNLPPDFFASTYIASSTSVTSTPATPNSSTIENPPNRVALALALFGWQRLSNPRMGAVRDTISCHTCLRRLGLWMFKSKQVDPDGTVVSPAPMDHLDPVAEHRFFCPWKNMAAQRVNYNVLNSSTDAAAWGRLVQIIRNEASVRGAFDRKHRKSFIDRRLGNQSAPSTPVQNPRDAALPNPANTPGALSLATDDGDDDEGTRVAQDKAMSSRLRRIKSLFVPKDKDRDKSRMARAASRASLGRLVSPPPVDDKGAK